MNWQTEISRSLPVIPAIKRSIVAARDRIRKSGGSQCGEDRWIIDAIDAKGLDWNHIRYIEVGANQPTQLSNTWRLYLKGARGLLIEPDSRCINLLGKWRRGDLILQSLAGDQMGIETLMLHRNTTMNAISGEGPDFIGEMLVPVCDLDSIFGVLRNRQSWDIVDFLSIDTEGHDKLVLAGGQGVLQSTRFVCLEHWGSEAEAQTLQTILGSRFKIALQTRMNIIFENVSLP